MRGRFTTSIYQPVYKELSGTSLSWCLSLTVPVGATPRTEPETSAMIRPTLGAPLPGLAAGEVGGAGEAWPRDPAGGRERGCSSGGGPAVFFPIYIAPAPTEARSARGD
jgi:hypothetical protein